ncbi:hypothetical protein [Serratia phage SP1]|nr:hypothetical protein [Serratia phage SP1]
MNMMKDLIRMVDAKFVIDSLGLANKPIPYILLASALRCSEYGALVAKRGDYTVVTELLDQLTNKPEGNSYASSWWFSQHLIPAIQAPGEFVIYNGMYWKLSISHNAWNGVQFTFSKAD